MDIDNASQPNIPSIETRPTNPDGQSRPANRISKVGHYLLLTAVLCSAGLVYLLGNDQISLWDEDEAYFAQAGREMIERQDFIVPNFNGGYFLDKPVLMYWLMAGNFRVFGIGEFGARFGSSLGGVLACGLMYLLGRRLFNRQVGLIGAAILASCPLMMVESKLATADAQLMVFLVAALGLWLTMQGEKAKWCHAVLLGLALGLGTLSKGPVIWLFLWGGSIATILLRIRRGNLRMVGLVGISTAGLLGMCLWLGPPKNVETQQQISGWLVWLGGVLLLLSLPIAGAISLGGRAVEGRGGGILKSLGLVLLGIAVAAVVFLPWGLAAIIKTQGAYWSEAMGRHVVERSLESFEGHWGPPGYYLASWVICAFPWSVLAPLAIRQGWRRRQGDWRLAGLLGWVIVPWLVLEVVQTKLVHYVLGCYPAMAILIALLLYDGRDELGRELKSRLGRMGLSALWIMGIIWGGVIVTAIGFLCFGPLSEFDGIGAGRYDLLLGAGLGGLVTAGTGLAVRRSLIRGRPQTAVACGFVGVMVWGIIAGGLVAPGVSSYRISPRAAAVAKELSPTGARFVVLGFDEPSMVWYLDADEPVLIAKTSEELLAEYEKKEPICAIVSEKEIDTLTTMGFDRVNVGEWVDGLYQEAKWRKMKLWVGLNKAAADKKAR